MFTSRRLLCENCDARLWLFICFHVVIHTHSKFNILKTTLKRLCFCWNCGQNLDDNIWEVSIMDSTTQNLTSSDISMQLTLQAIKITTTRKINITPERSESNKVIFITQIYLITNNNWLNFPEIWKQDLEKWISRTTTQPKAIIAVLLLEIEWHVQILLPIKFEWNGTVHRQQWRAVVTSQSLGSYWPDVFPLREI